MAENKTTDVATATPTSLSAFFKKNKAAKANAKYAATKSLCDSEGKPLEWEIKPVSTAENERIQTACMRDVPIVGKPHQYRQKIDTIAYIGKLLAASVVFPDLLNAQLLDSYGVNLPEELLKEMIDDMGEYNDFAAFVQQFNGFASIDEDIESAKN